MAKKAYIGVGGKNLLQLVDQSYTNANGVVVTVSDGLVTIEGDYTTASYHSLLSVGNLNKIYPPGTYTLYTNVGTDANYLTYDENEQQIGSNYLWVAKIKVFTMEHFFKITNLSLYHNTGQHLDAPVYPMLLRGEYTLDTLPPEEPWRGGEYGVARKIKKGYVGVDGLAHKVKKAYIGIGGVARPCWSGGELAYYGTLDPITTRTGAAAASNSKYAIFAGGGSNNMSTVYSTVQAFDEELVKTNANAHLSSTRMNAAAASVGPYALFAGGVKRLSTSGGSSSSDPYSEYNTVDAYDTDLTRTNPINLGSARYGAVGASVGGYALFGGGQYNGTQYDSVWAYDSELVRTSCTSLVQAVTGLAATSIAPYALFAGGYSGYARQGVTAYDATLTATSPTSLWEPRRALAGAPAGNYALFAGGYDPSSSGTKFDTVDAYDENLTRSTPTNLSQARSGPAATSLGGYAMFAGGGPSDVVESYDDSLTRKIETPLSVARSGVSATAIGGYALFACGTDSSSALSGIVDAYTIV